MSAKSKPATVPKKVKRPGRRAFQSVSRDTNLPLRTFSEVRDRLDALVLLKDAKNRARLMEYYLLRGIEADERDLGLPERPAPEPVHASRKLAEHLAALARLPAFERLTQHAQQKVLALNRRGEDPTVILVGQEPVLAGAKKAR